MSGCYRVVVNVNVSERDEVRCMMFKWHSVIVVVVGFVRNHLDS